MLERYADSRYDLKMVYLDALVPAEHLLQRNRCITRMDGMVRRLVVYWMPENTPVQL